MNKRRILAGALALAMSAAVGDTAHAAKKRFEWTTRSAEAKSLLADLQAKIEHFEFGPSNQELGKKLLAADPNFAMGAYYVSAVTPPPDGQAHLDKAVELSKSASDGERRFISAMVVARANNGANAKDAIPLLEKLAADYPGERIVYTLLGQLYLATPGQERKAKATFEKALALYPKSPRLRSFVANEDLLAGRYAKARATLQAIERDVPKGRAPFLIRYGVTFSHLYEGQVDDALRSLETYLAQYKEAGLTQGFPEVFIWNSIARINLENGRLEQALAAYEKGYESVPGSSIPEDQKQLWLGRLHHGKCRTLARMGKHEEAWAEAETVRKMIEDGGEPAKQYLPAYHYLAGYLMLEKGDAPKAIEHLKQANPDDPFHTLLLGRAYEKTGDKAEAKKAYSRVVASSANGLERALAFREAASKAKSL